MSIVDNWKAVIALLVYDRKAHLRRTIEALVQNPSFARSRRYGRVAATPAQRGFACRRGERER
jgi:hypothetical protein